MQEYSSVRKRIAISFNPIFKRSYRILKIWLWKQEKRWAEIDIWNRENGYW